MRFLITGGCGFIGSHLSEALIGAGYTVEVIDDLSTGNLGNVAALTEHKRFHLTMDTIMNQELVERLVERSDFVFHLAAVVGVKRVLENPIDSILINVEGTHHLLKSCVKFNKRVLIASTSEVYGKNENVPFSEDADIIIGATKKRRWSYACAKAIDEFLALAYFAEKKLPVIIVRFFNTVGPRQSNRYGMVIPRFVTQALKGQPITIFGDGQQSRCFTHVHDVVGAIVRLIEAPGAYGEVLNIGSREEVTIGRLAELIKEAAGSSSPIVHIDPEQEYSEGFEDMKRRIPDTGKIEQLIGFAPTLTLKDIISQTVAYYRKQH